MAIVIPASIDGRPVTMVYGFSVCRKITSITILYGVTRIGDYAFRQCGMKQISIPSSVTSIDREAFSHRTGLVSVNIPVGVTSHQYCRIEVSQLQWTDCCHEYRRECIFRL